MSQLAPHTVLGEIALRGAQLLYITCSVALQNPLTPNTPTQPWKTDKCMLAYCNLYPDLEKTFCEDGTCDSSEVKP